MTIITMQSVNKTLPRIRISGLLTKQDSIPAFHLLTKKISNNSESGPIVQLFERNTTNLQLYFTIVRIDLGPNYIQKYSCKSAASLASIAMNGSASVAGASSGVANCSKSTPLSPLRAWFLAIIDEDHEAGQSGQYGGAALAVSSQVQVYIKRIWQTSRGVTRSMTAKKRSWL